LVVYCSDPSLISAKVQVKNKSNNKVISKTFGTSLKDSITQVSLIQPPLGNVLGDATNCVFYLVRKGTFSIKTFSQNGIVTNQDVEVNGGGSIDFVDIKGKELVTLSNGVKFTFYSYSSNKGVFPYKIFFNDDSIGVLNESSLPTSGVSCSSPNSTSVFTIVIPKSDTYNFKYKSNITGSVLAPIPNITIPITTSCSNNEIK
jgi:hypothetical protein